MSGAARPRRNTGPETEGKRPSLSRQTQNVAARTGTRGEVAKRSIERRVATCTSPLVSCHVAHPHHGTSGQVARGVQVGSRAAGVSRAANSSLIAPRRKQTQSPKLPRLL